MNPHLPGRALARRANDMDANLGSWIVNKQRLERTRFDCLYYHQQGQVRDPGLRPSSATSAVIRSHI